MATMPPPDIENAADAAQPGDAAEDGGTELCIKIAGDGSISVYQETGEDETAEQSAQPVASIGEALAWVLRTYKSLGKGDASEQFDAGFGAKQGVAPQGQTGRQAGGWRG